MWLVIELFGITLFTVGIGPRRIKAARWITNTDGHFELAPEPVEEYEYEEDECRLGFH